MNESCTSQELLAYACSVGLPTAQLLTDGTDGPLVRLLERKPWDARGWGRPGMSPARAWS